MFARMFERSSLVRRNCQKVDEVCFIDQSLIQCTGFLLWDEEAGNPHFGQFSWMFAQSINVTVTVRVWLRDFGASLQSSFHVCDGNSSHLIAAREPFYPKYDDVMYKNHTNGVKYCQDLCNFEYLLIVFVCKIRFSFHFQQFSISCNSVLFLFPLLVVLSNVSVSCISCMSLYVLFTSSVSYARCHYVSVQTSCLFSVPLPLPRALSPAPILPFCSEVRDSVNQSVSL